MTQQVSKVQIGAVVGSTCTFVGTVVAVLAYCRPPEPVKPASSTTTISGGTVMIGSTVVGSAAPGTAASGAGRRYSADAPGRTEARSNPSPEAVAPKPALAPAQMEDGNTAGVKDGDASQSSSPTITPPIASWPGIARGASIYGRPTGAICEDGLRRGVTFDMNAVEPALALADGRELPPGTRLRVRVGDVRLGNGDDPSIARFELAAVEWNGQWQPVTAAAYRVPFERRRSVGASALKGAAIGAAAGTIVSLVFKTDLAPSLLIGAAAGAAIGASTAGASQLSCIDPAQTKLGFEF